MVHLFSWVLSGNNRAKVPGTSGGEAPEAPSVFEGRFLPAHFAKVLSILKVLWQSLLQSKVHPFNTSNQKAKPE